LNKAATQYTKRIIRRCASQNGMIAVGIHDYAFHTDFPYLDHLSASEIQRYQHIFKPNGYLYSVFGGMIEGILELEKYIIVLMVRDPRDVLVSGYYSIAYSHKTPNQRSDKYEEFIESRKTAKELTIDEHVVAKSKSLYDNLHRYKTLLLDKYPNVYVTTYEDMISDFQGWLNNLLNNCYLKINNELLQLLVEENDLLQPKKEDIHKHIRKGKSGDYKEKLRLETIEYLNVKFSPILAKYGYV